MMGLSEVQEFATERRARVAEIGGVADYAFRFHRFAEYVGLLELWLRGADTSSGWAIWLLRAVQPSRLP